MGDSNHQIRLVGAGFDRPAAPASRVPTGGVYQPDRLAAEFPPNPDLDPAADDPETVDLRRVARRLVVAFVAIVGIAIVNFAVLRPLSADLPPVVLLGSFAVIAGATILSLVNRSQPSRTDLDVTGSDGCAMGACAGPRPVGELSRRVAAQRQRHRLPGRSDNGR